jgi:hypothetical protein
LTRVNIWIKVVIIIILKLESSVDPRRSSGHWSGGSTQLAQKKLKIIKATLFSLNKKNHESQRVFNSCFIPG